MDARESLIEAALKVFADAGSRGATTRRIAQLADVNEVTLFRLFKSKDDLLHAALQEFTRRVQTRRLPDEPVDPRAELVEWCRAHHRDLHKHRALIRKAMGEHEERPEHCACGVHASIRIADELTDYLRQMKRKGLATGDWDERAATNTLMGALFSDAMGRDTMPERYPYTMRDAVDHYVDLLLRAIGATSAPSRTAGPDSERGRTS
ncbi:MAG: TetR/AcrR family transcriptional regulator [Acidobacteria bacterium]|nr:TetR/AcrR family transcriptional regulator [Acidobacteriota bacterium]